MQYKNYKVEDFLFDEFFVKWVKNPGPETEHFWKTWMEKHPGQLQIINQARDIVNSIEPRQLYTPSTNDYDEVLENILKQTDTWSKIGYRKQGDYLTALIKYAALFIILLCLGALVTYVQFYQSDIETVAQTLSKSNPYGQKTTFVLSDGTKVKLNAGSTLTYPDEFINGERKVVLEGEAFFEVKRDETQPFIVETKDLTTIVLGTSFNIKSYPDEHKTSVAVSSGKVKVMKRNEAEVEGGRFYLLEKNQMVSYNSRNNSFLNPEAAPENAFTWKDNIIMFKGEQPEEIFRTLSRWYGVEFEFKGNKKLVGDFTGDYHEQSLQIVLDGLRDQYNFEHTWENKKKVIIY